MLTVYGTLMPLRLLEEVRFWKLQEKEHTVVLRELAPTLESSYVKLLADWEPVFGWAESEADRWIETVLRSPSGVTPYVQMQIEGLLLVSVEQSKTFLEQLQHLLTHSAASLSSPTVQTVGRHIMRESEYFLDVLERFMSGALPLRTVHETPAATSGAGAPVDSKLMQSFASATFFPLRQQQRKEAERVRLHVLPAEEEESLPAASSGTNDAPVLSEEQAREPLPSPPPEPTATGEGVWSSPLTKELQPVPIGGHSLPPLPYPYNALEPHLDEETMRLHHDQHHQVYVNGLNRAEKRLAEARTSGDFTLVKHWEREVAFHGAGHYLHTLFWKVMSPRGGGKPAGPAAAQMMKDYGSYEAFRRHFSEAADQVEGGGWTLWVWSPRSHRTEILQAEKHQNLSQWEAVPLLVLDVWEHAYYVKYRTDRAAYITAWWNVVCWPYVNDRLEAARQLKWTPG